MGSDLGGRFRPDAEVAGHLLALVSEHRYAELGRELSSLMAPPDPAAGRGSCYGGVLAWLTGAIADVAVARLGRAAQGESFILEVRTAAGQLVDARQLPPRQARVARSVLALLAGDRAAARAQWGAAERESDSQVRVTTLIEALTWLNALLDAPTPALPDPPPE
ncbi:MULTISPECIES: hypothetical protein [unclassified Rhodococcus (in: high G+C Gram-positive bacteria)]|uniref:hypothetical protein n=1 Tax=unclassified Rhodococcus (in: high G+C Gram-positive bacteria) TaxID=192944 RepID=UPI00163B03F6|nr:MULTISPECIES: hypothetical protein [unclassified Rhodococcus (in: high G+C Gram-positive bacteria)]MBC2644470.1 hypothetical protein [Rhodococcus sp. 3A]MBC2897842.1 hypothetical protein [Rhodococcus sp. 4CII]